MGLFDWLNLFTFAWLRRCKTCGERGSKCICKRPSVALEHIFFLEERKNKYGARNFSHVSDTMMTTGTNSSTLTNSTFSASATTFYTNSGSTNYISTGSTSIPVSGNTANFTNNTVMMNRESVSDCASVDYIYPASQPSMASSATSGTSYHRQLPVSSSMNQHRRHHRRSRRHHEPEPEPEPESNALVRKHSGRMVRKTASAPLENGVSRFEDLSCNEYMLTADNIEIVTASQRSHRGRSERTTGGMKHRSQQQRSVSFRAENTLVPRRGKQQQGSSFKFYGRGGSGQETAAAMPMPTTTTPSALMVAGRSTSSRAPSHSLASSDALVVRQSTTSTSALGSSICSDRMSVDNNFGSYNPRAGRLLESGFAPSIQEDDEALQRLDGWLHSSPTSTADSFMMSRAMF